MAITLQNITYGQSTPSLQNVARGMGEGGSYISPATQAYAQQRMAQTDFQASAANAAGQYRGAAEDQLGAAGKTLTDAYGKLQGTNSGVMSVLGGIMNGTDGVGIDQYLSDALSSYGQTNQYAEEAKAAANGISNSVASVRDNASQIANVANSLGDYAPTLRSYGESLFSTGGDLIGGGQQYIGQGNSLLGLDANASGLSGSYAKALAALDPSLAVSLAANDARTSYETAGKTASRAMSRQGVTGSSGRSAALEQQANQALAMAVAAAKTRARLSSSESYLSAMRGAVSDANALGSTGSGIVGSGVSAQSQGVNSMQSAAGILVSQGQLYGSAASANAQAGSLLGTQANALTSAGQLTTAGGQLALGAANAATAAQNSRINAAGTAGTIASNEMSAAERVANQQNTAASYYSGMFNQYATMAGNKLFS